MTATRAALTAFREVFMQGDFLNPDEWDDPKGRWLRYAILWANYDNTIYRKDVHTFANLYKATYGMYSHSRRLFGIPYRLGDFWQSYLWGGRLDVVDGLATDQGALPILTDNEGLRQPIAAIWVWSRWATKKDICPLWGSVLGDSFIRIRDDTDREKVYLELVHPGTVWGVEKDPFGNVKSYTIIETRQDPRKDTDNDVEYKEIAQRDQGRLLYSTHLDGDLYDWREYEDGVTQVGAQWTVEYDFVPLVHIMHTDTGLDYGVGEVSQALEKVRDIDDATSMRSDQLRKTIRPKWFCSGMNSPKAGKLTFAKSANTDARPEASREDEIALYATDPAARVAPLVAPLDVQGAIAHAQQIIDGTEDDYPELKYERLRRGGILSGAALRIARQPTVTKVERVRAMYDGPLVKAQQMALAIGGLRGYFGGLSLDSYEKGDLDHSIGPRAVFKPDPAEQSKDELEFWQAAKAAIDAGYDLELFLEDRGWTEKKIERYLASDGKKAKEEMRQMGALGLVTLRGDGRE